MVHTRLLLSLAWFLLIAGTPVHAHPGDGIVSGGQGIVYYSDLADIWATRSGGDPWSVVRDVHSHQLHWTADGELVGEDVRHVGDNRFRRRLWSWRPGRTVQFGEWRDGHPWDVGDYGIPRDLSGRQYLIRGLRLEILGPGEARDQVPLPAASPGWLTIDQQGRLLFTAGDALLRWQSGMQAPEVIASGLIEWRSSRRLVDPGHALLGLCSQGDVTYVAVNSARALTRVHQGQLSEVYRSPLAWSPSGCTVDADGHLWVLEYSLRGKVRVRRVER